MFKKLKLIMKNVPAILGMLAFGIVYSMIITNDKLQPWILGGVIVVWIFVRER